MRRLFATLALGALMTTAAGAQDDWPNRPVRVISTFAAGGTADILARIVAEHLSTAFKQQFFVEVRAGAGGQIGVKAIVDSPDLYTIGITNISHLVMHPMTQAGPRLRSEEGSRQHRLRRRLAGAALGQSEERHQDAQGVRRARQEGAAELFVVGARQHGPSGRAELLHHVRHQGRTRAVQGRLAGAGRSGRRSHRVVVADRVVHRELPPRQDARRSRGHHRAAHARLAGPADLQGAGLRPADLDLVRHLRPRRDAAGAGQEDQRGDPARPGEARGRRRACGATA